MNAAGSSLNVAYTSSDWRGVALSNFSLSPFLMDGRLMASVEGFIQGLKFPEDDARRMQAFQSNAWDAKKIGAQADKSGAWWAGQQLAFGGAEHHRLVARAVRARIEQSVGLCHVLMGTAGLTLIHETGHEPEPAITSLPATVFCRVLTDLREELLARS
ncbi:hypothetical protein LKR43_05650 [Pusillimonas sp. MFBS29]|uniref:hypothetical protein n=1 Tax=Pusillimonas sp. MFBS29 TaxID=2886690 RepID=UPI001D11D089|nr:hypothetical protein [Pusillimonas sp. MFBS29]MCC2595820.1 hypothetical protein [Pusillimonas sp. MFBS29]